jgi:hypothetical protein
VSGLELELQGAQLLEGLVVQVACPALALGLGREHGEPSALGLDGLGGGDGDRRARREGTQEVLVVGVEHGRVAVAVECDQHAACVPAEPERRHQGRRRATRERVEAVAHAVGQARHARGRAGAEHAAGERPLGPKPDAPDVLTDLAGRAGDAQPGRLLEQHEQGARVDQGPSMLDDHVEDPFQIRLEADGPDDRGGRLEPAHRPLQLTAAVLDVLIEARVVDRYRGPVREHDHELLVRCRELLAAGLVGEIQVPERLAADRDRHAEEARHRRMPGREPVRPRVMCDVGQP